MTFRRHAQEWGGIHPSMKFPTGMSRANPGEESSLNSDRFDTQAQCQQTLG